MKSTKLFWAQTSPSTVRSCTCCRNSCRSSFENFSPFLHDRIATTCGHYKCLAVPLGGHQFPREAINWFRKETCRFSGYRPAKRSGCCWHAVHTIKSVMDGSVTFPASSVSQEVIERWSTTQFRTCHFHCGESTQCHQLTTCPRLYWKTFFENSIMSICDHICRPASHSRAWYEVFSLRWEPASTF